MLSTIIPETAFTVITVTEPEEQKSRRKPITVLFWYIYESKTETIYHFSVDFFSCIIKWVMLHAHNDLTNNSWCVLLSYQAVPPVAESGQGSLRSAVCNNTAPDRMQWSPEAGKNTQTQTLKKACMLSLIKKNCISN